MHELGKSIPEADRKIYTAALCEARPDARGMSVFRVMAATGKRFRAAFANEFVLSIGGEKSLGNELGVQMKVFPIMSSERKLLAR
jgi:hypothetical protein